MIGWISLPIVRAGNCTNKYDIVSGPMADDTIWDYVQDYLDGSISRAAFFELARFKHPTHQMSFHTIAALRTLRFIEAKELTRHVK